MKKHEKRKKHEKSIKKVNVFIMAMYGGRWKNDQKFDAKTAKNDEKTMNFDA